MYPTDWWKTAFGTHYASIYEELDAHTTPKVTTFLLNILPRGAKVLDLACGNGRITKELLKEGYDVIGADYSAELLALAGDGPFIQADMRDLDAENEFDAVISIFTSFGYFDDADDDRKVVANVFRALKPRGAFVLDLTPAQSDEEFVYLKREKGTEAIDGRYRQYSEAKARRLLTNAGFREPNVYWRYDTHVVMKEPRRMILVAQKP